MKHLPLFRMPNPVKITGRSSSITNSFINAILPVVWPTDGEVREALERLGMADGSCSCAYCGDIPTEWDHLRPLVKNRRPTGYISEIHNLVPSCGKCNQSKGNKPWEDWMRSAARLSPASRGIEDLEQRIARLRDYEAFQEPTKLNFAAIAGPKLWAEHWENWEKILRQMKEAQTLAAKINEAVREAHRNSL